MAISVTEAIGCNPTISKAFLGDVGGISIFYNLYQSEMRPGYFFQRESSLFPVFPQYRQCSGVCFGLYLSSTPVKQRVQFSPR